MKPLQADIGERWPVRIRLLLVPLCCSICCLKDTSGHTTGPDTGTVSLALSEIRIQPARQGEPCEAKVTLWVDNLSNRTQCILPTESRVFYTILHDNGEFDLEAAGSCTHSSPAPKEVSELDLPSIVVARGARAKLEIGLSVQTPKGTSGRLELTYQCEPFYPGDRYRGVPICREKLRMELDVVVARDPQTGEMVITGKRPEAQKKQGPSGKGEVGKEGGAATGPAGTSDLHRRHGDFRFLRRLRCR